MAHTNQTAHYHLPQYVGTDIINPLTDTNKAYEDIDTALYEQGQSIADVVDDIDALKIQNGDSALDTTAQTLSGAINELKNGADALGDRVTTNETNIGTLQTQMSTATGNITTLNTSVAGLQTEVASKASATALDNLTTKVGTGNLDTVAQNCVDAINEVNAKIPEGGGVSADEVTYDNTDSGLTATDVQSAIDELASTKANKSVEIASYTTVSNNDYSGIKNAIGTAWYNLSITDRGRAFVLVGNRAFNAMGNSGSFQNLVQTATAYQSDILNIANSTPDTGVYTRLAYSSNEWSIGAESIAAGTTVKLYA